MVDPLVQESVSVADDVTPPADPDVHGDDLPHDLQAERVVLGAVMASTNAIIDVVEILRPDDLHGPGHGFVYDAVLELYGTRRPVTPTAVVEVLRHRNLLEQAGGEEYVRSLPSAMPKGGTVVSFSEIVEKKSLLRRVVKAGGWISELGRQGHRGEVEVEEITGRANSVLATAIRGDEGEDNAEMGDLLHTVVDGLDARASSEAKTGGVPTGFVDLDEITDGLPPSSLTVIGSGPGVGSTTLALDFIRFAALNKGIEAAFLSLTDTVEAVTQRVISARARIRLTDLRSGRMTDEDWTRMARVASELSEIPLTITAVRDTDIESVLFTARDLVWRYRKRLVVIDSLHMLTARRDMRYENREREIAEVTRRLKRFALETGAAVVVTAQLSTNPGPRQPVPPRPSLADLRDSGTIAHVADLVVLINRPDTWERDDPRAGEADLILAKHHNGPTATVVVAHQLHYSRFTDLVTNLPPPTAGRSVRNGSSTT